MGLKKWIVKWIGLFSISVCYYKKGICVLSSPHFDDEERLKVLVMSSAQELSNGISYSGHIYAMTRAGRSLTPTADLYEKFTGMDQVIQYQKFTELTGLCMTKCVH